MLVIGLPVKSIGAAWRSRSAAVAPAAPRLIKGQGIARAIGMILTLLPMAGFGAWAVYRSLP